MLIRMLLLAGIVASSPVIASAAAAAARPNFIVILVDDLGWADLSAYGSTFYRTPHIDGLARDGMKFTAAYAAAPVCSPTRAALLTGKYPARLQLTDWLPGRPDRPDQKLAAPRIRPHLPLEEVTLAEALQSAGYAAASIGKWHLGGAGFGPQEQGFDLNIAGDHTGTPLSYFAPFKREDRFMPGLERAPEGEYLTDRLTAEALGFIERNRERPFLLYLPHYTVHIPLKAKPELIRAHSERPGAGPQTNAIYAAMIESLDAGVGRLLRALEEWKLADSTVVLFTSDNGGLSVVEGPNTPATSNAPLRNGKGYLQEGGIRVPLLVRWPGRIRPGSVAAEPVMSIDVLPTLLELAGVAPRPGVDGVSLAPLLRGSGSIRRDAVYWHYPHYSNQGRMRGAPPGSGPGAAMRQGPWKLIQHFESGLHELYNLELDPGESDDWAARMPEKVLEMGQRLYAWQNSVQAQWPLQNPAYQSPPVEPLPSGNLLLHARDAFVHGKNLRFEPQPHKNTLGYWTLPGDWASWEFRVVRSGRYRVEALQGCGKGSGGAQVEFSIGARTLALTVEDTGHFQNFVLREVGQVELPAGAHTLAVKVRTKPGVAVMDLRQVNLIRVGP